MKFKVLVTAPYLQPVINDYMDVFKDNKIEVILPPVKERLSEKELLEWMKDIDGVISGDDEFTAKVLKSAPKLKVISKWGTGIDSIDQDAAKESGIVVCNTLDAFTGPVGDQVLGYMLCFARKIPWINDEMRSGAWNKLECFSLLNHTLGVIGVGHTGKASIKRAMGFQMKLLGCDIVEMPTDFLAETGIKMVGKETLLRESDFVSLNCDLNSTSYHIMGAHEFKLMKPTAYFINTARGPLVDESAIIKALQNRQIAGAALDVFEDEPLPKDSPLRSMTNVLLSPHNANSSPEHWKRIHQTTLNHLLEELQREST
jgi:D-3-phosphoglycerate dehydrogenase